MQILQMYSDGSRTLLYEAGDRVRFVRDANGGGFLGAVKGECGTVFRRCPSKEEFRTIAFLDVQTDESRDEGYGTIKVAPWEVEPEDPDRKEVRPCQKSGQVQEDPPKQPGSASTAA